METATGLLKTKANMSARYRKGSDGAGVGGQASPQPPVFPSARILVVSALPVSPQSSTP